MIAAAAARKAGAAAAAEAAAAKVRAVAVVQVKAAVEAGAAKMRAAPAAVVALVAHQVRARVRAAAAAMQSVAQQAAPSSKQQTQNFFLKNRAFVDSATFVLKYAHAFVDTDLLPQKGLLRCDSRRSCYGYIITCA